MGTVSKYEIKINLSDQESAKQVKEFTTSEEVLSFVKGYVDHDFCLIVAHIKRNIDLGNFLVWTRGDDAFVRLDEHREHYAYDPMRDESETTITFFDDDFSDFSVSRSKTINRNKAFEALNYWIMTGKKITNLSWT